MMVLIVERAPVGLRGELSRWLLEPKSGVFVGRVSALVREKLWARVIAKRKGGDLGALLIYHSANEQGYKLRAWGATSRQIADYDGLELVRRLKKDRHR